MLNRDWSQIRRGRFAAGFHGTPLARARRLPVELAVRRAEIVIRACLPDVAPEDVALRISGRRLTIMTAKVGAGRRAAWYRQIRLPHPVYADGGNASLASDTLTITLPRADLGGIPL